MTARHGGAEIAIVGGEEIVGIAIFMGEKPPQVAQSFKAPARHFG